jgi:fumarylacetoacetate (FAA) hydrolase family protein
VRDVGEARNPAAAVAGPKGERIGDIESILANTPEHSRDPAKPYLLAPIDLQFARRQHARPNETVDFESALTSTADISLHRTKCRDGPIGDIAPSVRAKIKRPPTDGGLSR